SQLFRRIVPEAIDYSGLVELNLYGAKLDGELSELVNERVISLDLRDVSINDNDLAFIAEHCPRIWMLDLHGCPVTAAGLGKLAKLKNAVQNSLSREKVAPPANWLNLRNGCRT
ncbi:MAG: hypothetical protein HC828_08440, partial [Blastochloris sp.]|nr:hypothetical protein [Blastochloris sp.]